MGPVDLSPADEAEEVTETYRITSHNCALGPFGATVSPDQLKGLHLGALVDGGHLTPSSVPDPNTGPDGDSDASPKGI